MTVELEKQGITIDGDWVAFTVACRPETAGNFYSIGANGCYQSHLAALEAAGDDSILVIEDDCDFAAGANRADVPDCEIFWAGYNHLPAQGQYMEGSHLIGYKAGIAKRVALYLRQLLDDGKCIPFDGALMHFGWDNPDVRIVYAKPSLAYQRPSQSDIGVHKPIDRLPFISLMRRFKRSLRAR